MFVNLPIQIHPHSYLIIKQEMDRGADQELSPNCTGIRRSNRSRVPNPIYKEGIRQLKRSLNRNGRSKDDDSELQDDDRQSEGGSMRSQDADWVKCSLSNSDGSHKDLLVSIRVNKPVEMMKREYIARPKLVKTRDTEKKSEDQPKKMRKKSVAQVQEMRTQQSKGLCQLLLDFAQKALAQNSQNQISQEMQLQQDEQSQVQISKPRKETKEERQGKLLDVRVSQNQIIFEHSKLKTIEVQMKPQPVRPSMNTEPLTHLSNGMSILEIQEIFQNRKKNIYRSSIFI